MSAIDRETFFRNWARLLPRMTPVVTGYGTIHIFQPEGGFEGASPWDIAGHIAEFGLQVAHRGRDSFVVLAGDTIVLSIAFMEEVIKAIHYLLQPYPVEGDISVLSIGKVYDRVLTEISEAKVWSQPLHNSIVIGVSLRDQCDRIKLN